MFLFQLFKCGLIITTNKQLVFQSHGLECAVIRRDIWDKLPPGYILPAEIRQTINTTWLCGYVQVPVNNWFCGKRYQEYIPKTITDKIVCTPFGDRSLIEAFIFAVDNEERMQISGAFDVHGSITFSGKLHDFEGWWLGFDANHHGDIPALGGTTKDEKYMIEQCQKLAKQIVELDYCIKAEVN